MPALEMDAELLSWLMDEWTRRLAEVIESMTQERPSSEWMAAGEQSPSTDSLGWQYAISLAPGAALHVGTPENTWTEIGKRALTAAGVDEVDSESTRSTYLEILSQALAAVLHSLGLRLGKEITTESSQEAPLPALAKWNLTHLRFRDSEAFPIFLGFNPAAEAALAALQADHNPASGASSGAGAGGALPGGAALPPESKTLDLLMDVEMPVSVSFGRAELPLKEVLKLATGSIVELNRSISEPVEVVVNNCVIARGEVVVIEGNYGIRINQIISRQERLRTLK